MGPGPFWTGAEYLAPTVIRSPDRPAHSESLHRLSYPGPRSLLSRDTNDHTNCRAQTVLTWLIPSPSLIYSCEPVLAFLRFVLMPSRYFLAFPAKSYTPFLLTH